MSTKVDLLTPVGRLVQGSLYTGNTTDADNNPLVYKTGPNQGQPRMNFWFALAIAKGSEAHWNQTEWGNKIWGVGQSGFTSGQANSPHFAWKISDGDSNIPNKQGNKPCDYEGFAGHWILKFSGSFAPSLFNSTGTIPLTEPNAIQLGDYVQVFGSVEDNNPAPSPGVYLNHSMVAHAGFGQRITLGMDPKSVGFGNVPLPAGASATPIAQAFSQAPPPAQGGHGAPVQVYTAPAVQAPAIPVQPHTAILVPAIPLAPVQAAPAPVPARVMLPAAEGVTYEQFIAGGWSDAQLIQHGKMSA